MPIAVRQLHQFIVFFVIFNLVIAPLSAFAGKTEKISRSTLPFRTETFLPALIPIAPHAEHRLLIKFRAEASLEERREIMENYGEPELQTRPSGESVMTLKLKENVSTALPQLARLDKVIEWVEPDYEVRSPKSEILQTHHFFSSNH